LDLGNPPVSQPTLPPPNALPKQADIVIIGAGIQGCAAAYYMAKRGMKVVLLDKARVAAQQSSRAWGFVRVQMRDEDEVPLAIATKRLWRGLEAELEADVEWNEGGTLYLCPDEKTLAYRAKWLDVARKFDLETRMLSPAEIRARLPGIGNPGLGALFTETDGHAEPKKAAPAFAAAARRLGATIIEGNGALDIEIAGGQVVGVVSEAGNVKARTVLLCAGASSWRMLKRLDIDLPQSQVRVSTARTNQVGYIGKSAVMGDGFGMRQKPDGSLLIGYSGTGDIDITWDHLRVLPWYWKPFLSSVKGLRPRLGSAFVRDLLLRLPWTEAARKPAVHIRDPDIAPQRAYAEKALSALRRTFPEIGHVGIADIWAGQIDTLPDGIPVLDAPASPKGLLIATGFCGHGFALGPIVGQLMAELASGEKPSLDLRAFRLSRFAEGDVKMPVSIW
jgi:glycine/D-amino acid oxidase-like deaminating enzyme